MRPGIPCAFLAITAPLGGWFAPETLAALPANHSKAAHFMIFAAI